MTSIDSSRLAQSVEHQTLNLRVEGSSPSLGDFFHTETHCIYETNNTGVRRRAKVTTGSTEI